MKIPVIIAALLITVFSGCSRHAARHQPDSGIQMALDELTRLKSVTGAGLTYGEYSERVLTGKGNIDVALLRSNDEAAKPRIMAALASYVAARNEWKRDRIADEEATPNVQALWRDAEHAAQKASEYAFAGKTVRSQIDQEDAEEAKRKADIEDARKARESALAAEQDQVSTELEKAKNATLEAAAKQKAAEEKKQAAEAAAREQARRYAPEGTGFNINPIPVTTSDTVTTIPAGSALTITAKNPDGTVHVKTGDIETNVPSSEITNDRDLAALLRANEASKQEAIRQWRAHLGVAVEEARENAPSAPKPTPAATPDDDASSLGVKPGYVSPLEQKAH